MNTDFIETAFELASQHQKFDFGRAYNDAFNLAQKGDVEHKQLAEAIDRFLSKQDYTTREKIKSDCFKIKTITRFFQDYCVPRSKGKYKHIDTICEELINKISP